MAATDRPMSDSSRRARKAIALAVAGILMLVVAVLVWRARSPSDPETDAAGAVASDPPLARPPEHVPPAVELDAVTASDSLGVAAAEPERRRKPYRVLDEAGKPVAEVEVALCRRLGSLEPQDAPEVGEIVEHDGVLFWLLRTTTDGEGGFGISEAGFRAAGVEDGKGRVRILARKEGYAPHEERLRARPTPGYVITLEAISTVTVRVVRKEDEAPIQRYSLRYAPYFHTSPLAYEPIEVDVQDPEGVATLMPADHDWTRDVTVTVPGLPPTSGVQHTTLDTFASGELIVRVSRPIPLSGLVVDPDGKPVAGAEVLASNVRQSVRVARTGGQWNQPAGRSGSAAPRRAVTAHDGSFTIDSLENETWLTALHGEFLPACYEVPLPVTSEPIRLVLGRAAGVRIRRLDGSDEPVEGEGVSLARFGLGEEPYPDLDLGDALRILPVRFEPEHHLAQTDADGVAEFANLIPGWYYWIERERRIQARAGEMAEIVDRDPFPEEDLAPSPVATATVHGRIRVGGKPWTAGLFVAERFAETDEDGRFRVEGVTAGIHRVARPKDPAILEGAGIRFEVSRDATEVELDWDFPLCTLRGRILSHAERPTDELRLELFLTLNQAYAQFDRPARPIAAIPVREDGTFTFEYLTTGCYGLLARAKGYRMAFESFEVGNGEPTSLDLAIFRSACTGSKHRSADS